MAIASPVYISLLYSMESRLTKTEFEPRPKDRLLVHSTNRLLLPIIKNFGLFASSTTFDQTPAGVRINIPEGHAAFGMVTFWHPRPGDVDGVNLLPQQPGDYLRLAIEKVKVERKFWEDIDKLKGTDLSDLFGPVTYVLQTLQNSAVQGQPVPWLPPDRLALAWGISPDLLKTVDNLASIVRQTDQSWFTAAAQSDLQAALRPSDWLYFNPIYPQNSFVSWIVDSWWQATR